MHFDLVPCRTIGETFFDPDPLSERLAAALCRACEARAACLKLSGHEPYGVVAGLTPQERFDLGLAYPPITTDPRYWRPELEEESYETVVMLGVGVSDEMAASYGASRPTFNRWLDRFRQALAVRERETEGPCSNGFTSKTEGSSESER